MQELHGRTRCRWATTSLVLACACDSTADAPVSAGPSAETTRPAAIAEARPTEPLAVTEAAAPPVPAAPVSVTSPISPPADAEETFASVVARLADPPVASDDAGTIGLARLQAGAFHDAMVAFASASLRDRAAWKHPFNLACAASRGGEEGIARIALGEAVRRGGDRVVTKARKDPDLAAVRARAWFEPVLRGEPLPAVVPANPDPSPPAPPKAPSPPIEPAPIETELPRGSSTAIASARLAAITAELAQAHGVTPVVRASLEHHDADGAPVGLLIYEYSRYDACIATQADPSAAKKKRAKCRKRMQADGEGGDAACTDQWSVWVSGFDPPVLGKPIDLGLGCALRDVRRMDVLDIDADGRDELLVDLIGVDIRAGFREGEDVRHTRRVRVFRMDGSEQLAFDVKWTAIDLAPDSATARRFELHDDDADGHPDMRVWTREIVASNDLDLDDEMWPTGPVSEELGEIQISTWRYSEKKDRWIPR